MAGHPRPSHDHDGELHDHDRGLQFDMTTLFGRRRLLALFAGAGAVALVGCGSDGEASTATAGTTATPAAAGADASCAVIPEETAGPYPGDGSNGVNVLTESGVVRSDIRASFGSASGSSLGIPLTIVLDLVDTDGCTPLVGGAVYLWHADQLGRYSLYSNGVTEENYLRGVQEADASGRVTFVSNFPGCYDGRWPHIHFEVYPDLASSTSSGNKIATSQLALPEDVCALVYADSVYPDSTSNLSRVTLESDNVFRDGAALETPVVTGDVSAGFVATLTVGV